MIFVPFDKDMELEIGFDRNKHSAERCNESKDDSCENVNDFSDNDTSPLLRQRVLLARTRRKQTVPGAWLRRHWIALTIAGLIPFACLISFYSSAVDAFTWQSWATIALTLEALVLMAHNFPPDLVMLGLTVLLRVLGIITEEEAWRGFASQGILAIGVLFVVAKCLEEAGSIQVLAGFFLGDTGTPSPLLAVLQLCGPVALVSSVVNDTPLVAMMIPIVVKWANKHGLPVSWFLLPLSYSALLGGVVTIIGSSTNLVLAELINRDLSQGKDIGFQLTFFSTTAVAAPVALIGVLYMTVVCPLLLPGHAADSLGKARDEWTRRYAMTFLVSGAAAQRTPRALGLHRVRGARLVRIYRSPSPQATTLKVRGGAAELDLGLGPRSAAAAAADAAAAAAAVVAHELAGAQQSEEGGGEGGRGQGGNMGGHGGRVGGGRQRREG